MRNINADNITDAVLASQGATKSPRVHEVMRSLVRHLHDFVRETQLSEEEWMVGIDFLTRTGQLSNDKRQEFILLSDVLGVSMLVVAQNERRAKGATEGTVFGPFHVEGAPSLPQGADISNGARGEPLAVHCVVRSVDDRPIAGATVDVWQADGDGMYDIQDASAEEARGRAVLTTDDQGRFEFKTTLPVGYAVPVDGTVGELLAATGRHPWRPAHIHFRIVADGYRTLTTHVFRSNDPYLDSDTVFGVRESLIGEFVAGERGHDLSFAFRLAPVSPH